MGKFFDQLSEEDQQAVMKEAEQRVQAYRDDPEFEAHEQAKMEEWLGGRVDNPDVTMYDFTPRAQEVAEKIAADEAQLRTILSPESWQKREAANAAAPEAKETGAAR